MTTLTLTLSTMLADGQEVYQQIQVDQKDLETSIAGASAALFAEYSNLKSDFAAYLAKQPVA